MSHNKPNIILTVDIVLFTIHNDQLKVLTINRKKDPFLGQTALPGGYIRENETSKEGAIRVMSQKTGVKDVFIEQLYTFDARNRDPRGHFMSVTYLAAVEIDKIKLVENNLTETPEFLPLNSKLAFDHNGILEYGLQRLRNKFEYSNVANSLISDLFTLTELQNLYEMVLGVKLDKRNFRKKFLKLDLISDSGEVRKGLKQRPAKLYKFNSKEFQEIKKWI